jgi:putative peptide zinc metalloprotease protein
MRPRTKTVPWVRGEDGLIVALNPVPTDLRRIPDPDRSVEWLMRHADGSRTVDELIAAEGIEPSGVIDGLAELERAGLLVDADDLANLTSDERERWRNNLGFFDAYADPERGATDYHRQLRGARVLLLGAGGLGSMTLMNLMGLGVGRVTVVDFDRVEEANFSRQFIFRADDVGLLKVHRAGEWAQEFSPHTTVTTLAGRIESADDVSALLPDVDLVISAIDQPAEGPLWVNEACHRAGTPSIYGGFFFTKGRYESVWPGHSACLACLVLGETFDLQPINRATGPSVSIVGGLMALEAVRYLTGFTPPAAAATSWIVDFSTGAVVESVSWGRSPECPVCASPPGDASACDDPAPEVGDRVDVGHLTIQPDGGEYLIGDLARGNFIAVPEVGAVALRALQGGATVAEATARATAFAGTDVNVVEFVDVLRQRGLIRDSSTPPTERGPIGAERRTDRRTRPARAVDLVAGALFSTPSRAFAGLALLAGSLVLVLEPALRPSWESIVFLPDPALALLINVLTVVTMAGIHEGFHWLAARRLGLPARVRVSRRGLFVVFETDLTRLWGAPRRQRYVALLAGSAFDGTVLGVSLVARLAHQQGWITLPETLNRYLAIVVLGAIVALVGQTPVFMRTDLYAVLVNALGCRNLYRVSMLLLKNRFVRLSSVERVELESSSARDRRIGRWFSGLYLIGILGLTYLLFGLFIPASFSLVVWSAQNVATTGVGTPVFWEALVVATVLAAEVVGPPAHWLTGRLRGARGPAPTPRPGRG